jgi:hypothetical protein
LVCSPIPKNMVSWNILGALSKICVPVSYARLLENLAPLG